MHHRVQHNRMTGIINGKSLSSKKMQTLVGLLLGASVCTTNAFIPSMLSANSLKANNAGAMGFKTVTSSFVPRSTSVAVASSTTADTQSLEGIKEADLSQADKTPPPSTFFECTLQVSMKNLEDSYRFTCIFHHPASHTADLDAFHHHHHHHHHRHIPNSTNPSSIHVSQAYNAASAALKDGHKLIEVDFPPLPASEMANQASSANSIGAANIGLATDLAEYFTREGKQVVILVPDKDELDLIEDGLGTLEPIANVSIRAVRARAAESAENIGDLFFGMFTRMSK